MTGLVISNLVADGDFYRELTAEELKASVVGGAVGAGSISAGRYYEEDNDIREQAVTAAVASSSPRPFKINLYYSFRPRLRVFAEVD